MNRECYGIEELGELLAADAEDPRREHVRTCTRCRNLMESLREFQSPARKLPRTEVDRAEERMARALERAMSGETAPAGGGRARTGQAARLTGIRMWFDWWRHPWARVAAGAAVGVLIAVFAGQLLEGPERPAPGVVRGGREHALAAQPPSALSQGGLHFAWRAQEGIEAYEVIFYDLHLVELARVDAGSAASLEMSATDLARVAPSGEQVLWQVVGLRSGAEHARSQPDALVIP